MHKVSPETKAFKNWDKQFTRQELIIVRQHYLGYYRVLDRWPYKVSSWPQEFVQACVYQVSTTEEWQRFRVAMKGLSTFEKLGMLDNRYKERVKPLESDNPDGPTWVEYKIEKCRIDNYIGALVRGGQLNSDLEIVK